MGHFGSLAALIYSFGEVSAMTNTYRLTPNAEPTMQTAIKPVRDK
jgi:hypothetical protein